MFARKRFWRFIFTFFLAEVLGLTSNAATKPKIVSFHTKAAFSAQSTERTWSVPLKSRDGRTIYVLSLEPDFYVGHQVEGLDLVLRYPSDQRKNSNLLAPVGIWHGLQSYMFQAADFEQGAENTAFGKSRTISVKRLGLEIRVTVLNMSISPISNGAPQLDALDLQIDVDNLNPVL
jgi:hypothetical protein